jgi:hypothetical protein
MEHPAWRQLQTLLDAQRAAAGDTGRARNQNPGMITLRVPRGGLDPRSGMFYAHSGSLLQFMREGEGPGFVDRLGEGLARGQSVEQVLGAQARNLPRNLADLEREWKVWAAATAAARTGTEP